MAKFSVSYVKDHPVMFGGIIIVFGLIFWFLFRGGSTTVATSSGPSDAQVAAATQLQLAQVSAGVQSGHDQIAYQGLVAQLQEQYQEAGIGATLSLADIASAERISTLNAQASLSALEDQLNAQMYVVDSNNQFQIDYATIAANSARDQIEINAALTTNLAQMQQQAYMTSAELAVIPSLKKKQRATAFDYVVQTSGNIVTGGVPGPLPTLPKSGGGGLFSSLLNIVSPVTALI